MFTIAFAIIEEVPVTFKTLFVIGIAIKALLVRARYTYRVV